MIIEKLHMPYILASQHPLIHLTQLLTSIAQMYVIDEIGVETDDQKWFQDNNIQIALNAQLYNNAICIILHVLIHHLTMRMYGESKHQDWYNYSYINQLIMMLKVVINFACINYCQFAILGHYDKLSPDYNPKGGHSDLVIWLIYQLLMFYINIVS